MNEHKNIFKITADAEMDDTGLIIHGCIKVEFPDGIIGELFKLMTEKLREKEVVDNG